MARDIVRTPNAPAPPAAYSQAVRAAGLVFVSGTGPHDPVTGKIAGETIQEQTRQCLKNVSAILEAAGVPVTVRHNMGRDIAAACGQLRAQTQPKAYGGLAPV